MRRKKRRTHSGETDMRGTVIDHGGARSSADSRSLFNTLQRAASGVERTGFHAVIVPQEGKERIGAGAGEGSEPVRSRRWVARAP